MYGSKTHHHISIPKPAYNELIIHDEGNIYLSTNQRDGKGALITYLYNCKFFPSMITRLKSIDIFSDDSDFLNKVISLVEDNGSVVKPL